MGRQNKREELLDTAEFLFEHQGFGATGINQIARTARIVPMTLYNNFDNKDDLILALLERRSDRFLGRIQAAVDKAGGDPAARILAVFDVIDHWVRGEVEKPHGFAGCLFVKAAIEFTEPGHPIRDLALAYKNKLIDLFEAACRTGGFARPRDMALTFSLLTEGAIAQAQLLNDGNSVRQAKAAAACLLAHECKEGLL